MTDNAGEKKPNEIVASESAALPSHNPHPTVQVSGDAAQRQAAMLREREWEAVAAIKPVTGAAGPEDAQLHDTEDSDKKNFDQKIYWFPESYNALRRELAENWPEIWQQIGWYMAHNPQEFVSGMNWLLGMSVQFDTTKVGSICLAFLNKLRGLRGVSSINVH